MATDLSILKGLHPGLVLERELKRRKVGKGRFAISVDEFPQTLVAITKARRKMNTALALKIEKALGFEEGYFMTLQVFYDIKEEKRKQQQYNRPDLTLIRPVLFWDTRIDQIDWQLQKRAVIQRIFERGNQQEKEEITRFYGKATVEAVLDKLGPGNQQDYNG
jgi:plasmid maintenance system antidote protein VapI